MRRCGHLFIDGFKQLYTFSDSFERPVNLESEFPGCHLDEVWLHVKRDGVSRVLE